MSNSRYFRLQEIKPDSFDLDAPVEIEKGALLLDNQTKAILLQLRINILDRLASEISSVKLKIECRDDANEDIPGLASINDTFRDINLLAGKSFGDNTPIVLDKRVRRVQVEIEKVTFADGTVWHPGSATVYPPNQMTIDELKPKLRIQLNRDLESSLNHERSKVVFVPRQMDNYWQCVCGRLNSNETKSCSRCGFGKYYVFSNFTEAGLQNHLDAHIESVRIQEEDQEKERLLLLDRRKRTTKARLVFAGVAFLLLVTAALGMVLLPDRMPFSLLVPTSSSTPTPTPTPTYTPTITTTQTKALPTTTPTKHPIPKATINKVSNCRYGPSVTFAILTLLQINTSVDLIGVNNGETETWWKVRLADGNVCWVSGINIWGTAQSFDVPFVESPSTPTPAALDWSGTWVILTNVSVWVGSDSQSLGRTWIMITLTKGPGKQFYYRLMDEAHNINSSGSAWNSPEGTKLQTFSSGDGSFTLSRSIDNPWILQNQSTLGRFYANATTYYMYSFPCGYMEGKGISNPCN